VDLSKLRYYDNVYSPQLYELQQCENSFDKRKSRHFCATPVANERTTDSTCTINGVNSHTLDELCDVARCSTSSAEYGDSDCLCDQKDLYTQIIYQKNTEEGVHPNLVQFQKQVCSGPNQFGNNPTFFWLQIQSEETPSAVDTIVLVRINRPLSSLP